MAIKEFLSARADNESAKLDMYKRITQDGYFKLEDLETDVSKQVTLNTINTYLLASGINSDLVTPKLKTLYTLKTEARG